MIGLKLLMDILFFIFIGYFSYQFILMLLKMKQKVILPVTHEEIAVIRKHPDKRVDFPTYAKQKVGIIIYSCMLLLVIVMFLLGAFFQLFGWTLYLLIFVPLANSYNLLNLFAVVEDGLLSGNRFIPWKKIKSFQFVPIDINHKYYGFSKEANDGYELRIKTIGFPASCVVTSIEMKKKLINILKKHGREAERGIIKETEVKN